MEFLKYKVEWSILFVAVLFTLLSVFVDLQIVESTTWFARSGSIVVLLSVIVEFRLSSYIYVDVLHAARESARKSGFKVSDNPIVQANIKAIQTIKPEVPKSRKVLSVISHMLVIIGTIIWGYGDIWIN